jgi:hypothetical protein
MTTPAMQIASWAEALCSTGAAEPRAVLDAFGLRAPAAHEGDIDLETPAAGIEHVKLALAQDGARVLFVMLELEPAAALTLDELTDSFGDGRDLPTTPGGDAIVDFRIASAESGRECAVLARVGPEDFVDQQPRIRRITLYPDPASRE